MTKSKQARGEFEKKLVKLLIKHTEPVKTEIRNKFGGINEYGRKFKESPSDFIEETLGLYDQSRKEVVEKEFKEGWIEGLSRNQQTLSLIEYHLKKGQVKMALREIEVFNEYLNSLNKGK